MVVVILDVSLCVINIFACMMSVCSLLCSSHLPAWPSARSPPGDPGPAQGFFLDCNRGFFFFKKKMNSFELIELGSLLASARKILTCFLDELLPPQEL